VLVQSADHFIRVYLRREGRASAADELLGMLGYVHMDRRTGRHWTTRGPLPSSGPSAAWVEGTEAQLSHGERVSSAGPLWLGPLHDADLLPRTMEEVEAAEPFGPGEEEWARRLAGLSRWLGKAMDESGAPPFFYGVDVLGSLLSVSPPARKTLRSAFMDKGFSFHDTTFSPTGFKTDAPFDEVTKTMREAATGKH
jgi:tRNA (guanine26-N2/guanine27-N2)-dimethyltransferase